MAMWLSFTFHSRAQISACSYLLTCPNHFLLEYGFHGYMRTGKISAPPLNPPSALLTTKRAVSSVGVLNNCLLYGTNVFVAA